MEWGVSRSSARPVNLLFAVLPGWSGPDESRFLDSVCLDATCALGHTDGEVMREEDSTAGSDACQSRRIGYAPCCDSKERERFCFDLVKHCLPQPSAGDG